MTTKVRCGHIYLWRIQDINPDNNEGIRTLMYESRLFLITYSRDMPLLYNVVKAEQYAYQNSRATNIQIVVFLASWHQLRLTQPSPRALLFALFFLWSWLVPSRPLEKVLIYLLLLQLPWFDCSRFTKWWWAMNMTACTWRSWDVMRPSKWWVRRRWVHQRMQREGDQAEKTG